MSIQSGTGSGHRWNETEWGGEAILYYIKAVNAKDLSMHTYSALACIQGSNVILRYGVIRVRYGYHTV